MLEVLTQLLILQDRDQRIHLTQVELGNLAPQRQALEAKSAAAQTELTAVRQRLKEWEAKRKESELEVEEKKQMIARYSLQQFQTKKNDEYRALSHEIATCQDAIRKLEDEQLDLMEKAEQAQKEVAAAQEVAHQAARLTAEKLAELTHREQHLSQQLAELKSNRDQLAAAVEESVRSRYERLIKGKGGKVLSGIDHGVCGGCHMKLPPHVVISCQTDETIVNCPNCSRILYYTPEMDLSPSD
jgi:uncharacterized protein